ncbi:MAG TPA: universal stress protein [Gemmatimonadales bacterium]
MSLQPIVVGVDASPEAAGAAAFALRMPQRAGTSCHLVHAARDAWASIGVEEGVDQLWHALIDQARKNITAVLAGVVPRGLVDEMTVRLGRAPLVLKQAVSELGAELVVLGSKHHSASGRWLGGSTSLNVARTTDVPVLVVAGSPTAIRRVLVAVDGSAASRPTLEAADRYAALFGAELRVLSVIEPLPVIPEAAAPDATEYYRMSEELLQRAVWPLIRTSGAEKVVRYGMTVETILREATEWQADLLVAGSHGRGWIERMLVGSVTERLLNHLPTSLLVVPVRADTVADEDDAGGAELSQALVAIA